MVMNTALEMLGQHDLHYLLLYLNIYLFVSLDIKNSSISHMQRERAGQRKKSWVSTGSVLRAPLSVQLTALEFSSLLNPTIHCWPLHSFYLKQKEHCSDWTVALHLQLDYQTDKPGNQREGNKIQRSTSSAFRFSFLSRGKTDSRWVCHFHQCYAVCWGRYDGIMPRLQGHTAVAEAEGCLPPVLQKPFTSNRLGPQSWSMHDVLWKRRSTLTFLSCLRKESYRSRAADSLLSPLAHLCKELPE